MDPFEATAQPGVDANDADYAVVSRDDDVAHAAAVIGPAEEVVQRSFGRQDENVCLHNLRCAAHEEHVGVQRLWNQMASQFAGCGPEKRSQVRETN